MWPSTSTIGLFVLSFTNQSPFVSNPVCVQFSIVTVGLENWPDISIAAFFAVSSDAVNVQSFKSTLVSTPSLYTNTLLPADSNLQFSNVTLEPYVQIL